MSLTLIDFMSSVIVSHSFVFHDSVVVMPTKLEVTSIIEMFHDFFLVVHKLLQELIPSRVVPLEIVWQLQDVLSLID